MKSTFLLLILATSSSLYSQRIHRLINEKETKRVESVLASDDMKGRLEGTPDIDRAADFIADEFKKAGLQPLHGNSYMQEFVMVKPKLVSESVEINGQTIDPKNILVVTSNENVRVDENSGYEVAQIKAGDNFLDKYSTAISGKKNLILLTDTSFARYIRFFKKTNSNRQEFKDNGTVIFLLSTITPATFKITAAHKFEEVNLKNIAGVLPGKGRSGEYVIFSGHYDHLGIGKPVNNDSIYNGANDDASGTTAVIMLAKYFRRLHNNERSIIFVAFTAEEEGELGSEYFSNHIEPEKVMAMFNIEMIGTESKWGKNSAYITGFDKTDMGTILQRNLEGTGFSFYPDPYEKENLFYRSDNATLARKGVPAHTISTSKMDNEPHYHLPSDEISTLDMKNMTEIIKSIAVSAQSIIQGKDTPSRIKKEDTN